MRLPSAIARLSVLTVVGAVPFACVLPKFDANRRAPLDNVGGQGGASGCDGCLIKGHCHVDGQPNSDNPCEVCDVKTSAVAWSDNDGAECDDGNFCNGDDRCLGGLCSDHMNNPCGIHSSCVDEVCTCDSFWVGEDCDICVVHVSTLGRDSNLGGTWEDALETVEAGVDSAAKLVEAGLADSCEVWVAEGEYVPEGADREATFQLRSKVHLYGGFAGDETRRVDRDWEEHLTVLSGDVDHDDEANDFETNRDDNLCHVVTGADDSILDGFMIRGGHGDGNCALVGGGGLLNIEASPVVRNTVFEANYSGENGGGIYNSQSSPRIRDCLFTANSAARYGGAMYNREGSVPRVAYCTFSDNFVNFDGGAIYNNGSSPEIVSCTFANNATGEGCGGAICNEDASPLIANCGFIGNSAAYHGGGIENFDESSPTLVNCTFRGNSAEYAGGMFSTQYSFPTVTNCIFWENEAPNTNEVLNDTGSVPTLTYSTVQGGCSVADDCTDDDTGNRTDDPLFDGDTLRLTADSPCIDQGHSEALPADSVDLDGDDDLEEPLPFDLYGNPRVVETVDQGVHERQ